MSSIEEARTEFYSTRELLKEVHSQEELDAVTTKLDRAKKVLWDIDPEFRAIVSKNEQKIKKMEAESRQEIGTAAQDAVKRLANVEKEVTTQLRKTDILTTEWVHEHRLKIRTPEEAEVKINFKLFCPICNGPDRGNTINGEPACINCQHQLVPRGDLKNYNRAYRRRWKKNHR